MKTSEMTPEQKQLLTDKLLRIAQVKKIDIIKMHRQVLVDVLNGEGHTRTVQETGKNLTKSGIGVTKVETYRSPANNIQAVRLNRQLQDDWDKLVVELTPQPDLLARLLYHQGAEHEPDFYGEKVDVFVEGLLDCNPLLPEISSQTVMADCDPPSLIATQSGNCESQAPYIAPHSPLPASPDEPFGRAAKKDARSVSGITNGGNKAFSNYPAKNRIKPDFPGYSNTEDTHCEWDKDADETLQRIYNRKDDD